MAKISLSKLNLTKNTEVIQLSWNDLIIEVKKYLPVEEKSNIVERVLNASVDEKGYYNTMVIDLNLVIETVLAYTNISVTEKQKEDKIKLYDLFVSSGLYEKIMELIPSEEHAQITLWVNDLIKSIYSYRNSIFGILDVISEDYKNLNLDAMNIKETLSDPENLKLLKDVLTKLG